MPPRGMPALTPNQPAVRTAPADGPAIDGFSRFRVSEAESIFDSKLIGDARPLRWDEAEVSGEGTAGIYNINTSSLTLSVSDTTAGKRVRQTYRHFNYQPGKAMLILLSGVLQNAGAGQAGIIRSFGYFNDDNGLFLRDNEGVIEVVLRSYASGAPVDDAVPQSAWNIDRFGGSGSAFNPSGMTLDFMKAQVLVIDFAWLGVGRVRFGFLIAGEIRYAHEFLHANDVDVVYMSTPNLPLRYEIENTGAGGAASLEFICASVEAEGGIERRGQTFTADLGAAVLSANATTASYALIGIRLKATHVGITIVLRQLTVLSSTNDHFLWRLYLNPTVAGTFTYSDLTNSGVQVAKGDVVGNPSENTITGGVILDAGYGTQQEAIQTPIESAFRPGVAIDGTADTFVVGVQPMTSNMSIRASLTWREL
jgi:hypothetical protein